VASDEQDLMAEGKPEERAAQAPPEDSAERPSESPTPEADAALPVAAESQSPAQETVEQAAAETTEETVEQAPAETAEVAELSPEPSPLAELPEAAEVAAEPIHPPEEPAATSEVASAEPSPEVEAAPAAAGAVTPPAEAAWYVIHCYSGYENKVRHNLEQRIETMGMKDRIFDVVIPTQEEIEVREGKRRTVERHIFPGYVLVNMTLSEESWYVVRNTPGVTGFVGMGNLPTPLRPEEVAQIIKRMEAEAPTVKVSFKAGERVRIIDGPFNDFRGTVADIDMEHTKVRVMVSFFGRETPVELDFLQVEKA
jgi:transcription termination/antitermination protein NusG